MPTSLLPATVLRAQQRHSGISGQGTSAPCRRSQPLRPLQGWRKERIEGNGRGLSLHVVAGTAQSTTTGSSNRSCRRSDSSLDKSSSTGRTATRASEETSSLQAGEYLEAGTSYAYGPNGSIEAARFLDDPSRDGAVLEAANSGIIGATASGIGKAAHSGLEEQSEAPARKLRSTARRKTRTSATSTAPAQRPGDADVAAASGAEYPETSGSDDESPLGQAAKPRTRRKSAAGKKSSKATSLAEAELLSSAPATDLSTLSIESVNGAPVASAAGTRHSRSRSDTSDVAAEERSGSDSSAALSLTTDNTPAGKETGAADVLREEDALQLRTLLRSAAAQPQAKSSPDTTTSGSGSSGTPESAGPGPVKLKMPGLSPKGPSAGSAGPESFRCDPSALVPGDHLVHAKLGVCRFLGTRKEVPPGREKAVKYLLLKFGDGTAKLSSKQAKQVLYRYGVMGTPGRAVTLSKLNDTVGWEKRRAKGEAAVKRMVMDMMELYVHRLRQRRPVYPKLTAEMEEFSRGFPYTPTPDQLQAFEDVERDMSERETPMDRLICGDVGFGKTEVALRAIFRAVGAGRQVMVLAPTTVLAKQHYKVISARFAAYPDIHVGLLSRFQKETERREILERIKEGTLHIVAGTHSLLGAQVVYHNLGLLVIDEEQRFGVRQKERISSLKTTVDLLTLSATPIPRTLYMSLHGFRDASRITTPPPERRPISTHVQQFSIDVVREAIQRELRRGGQVFYVRPRIEGMEAFMNELRAFLPDVPVEVAHGQMRAAELEERMEAFSAGEIRVLLCTTIIESGIDIRSANTIIIEDAHLFGLAQVYQLRGRVGRSDIEAHAYLLHPSLELLGTEAQERLQALKQHGGLGQGYELAQRDMDIRGIGDVFGERQSGDVGGVGYYLFMEMLHNTLNKVEQESLPRVHFDDVRLEIAAPFEAIPVKYVPVALLRERLQRDAESAARQGMQALLQFCNRMRKEFGDEPPEMEMTLKVLFLKRIATDLGIERIFVREGTSTVIMATAMKQQAFQRLLDAITDEELKDFVSFHAGRIELASRLELKESDVLNRTLACLGQMRNALPSFVNFL